MATRLMQIGKLRTNGGTQPRLGFNDEVLTEYEERWKANENFPPVEACFDGERYWLWDGFHRLESARRAGVREIEVKVTQGNLLHAQWLSYSANKAHGLRRTNEEKQTQVKNALIHEMGAKKSDHEIAKHCGVATATVWRWRNELVASGTLCQIDEREVKRGEQTYTLKANKVKAASQDHPTPKSQPSPAVTEPEDAPSVIVLDKEPAPREREIPEPPRKLDSLNRQIHPKAQPVFDAVPPVFDELRQLLITVRTKWNAFMNDPMVPAAAKGFYGAYSVKARMEKDVALLISILRTAQPYTTCVYCKCQQECTVCNNTYVMTEDEFDRAPKEIKPEDSPPYDPTKYALNG